MTSRIAATVAERTGWASGRRWTKIRLVGIAAVFSGLFGVLGHHAYQLQIGPEAERLRRLAEEQYMQDVELPARRGRILDRNGIELAASIEVDSVQANPRQIAAQAEGTDPVARALAKVLGIDRKELDKKLHLRRFSTWIKRRISNEEARAVQALRLPGVFLAREPRRYYPNRALAGPLLGWAGVDGRGLEGIELSMDRELSGRTAEVQGLRDALGRQLMPTGTEGSTGTPGHDVVTTIDKFIQHRLERALESGVQKSHAKAGVAVALDPRNGEVLAMAAMPTFNPNEPGDAPAKGARNRAVTDPFEPGSTMKTFSIAAAVEAKLVELEEKWNCENGRWQVGSATIHDAEPNGILSTVEVLARSSNICTAKIARRSGKERVSEMLHRFGFGSPSGVDLPGERAGTLRPAAKWGEIELVTISFGQGVTATPLQLAAAYASIANGGTLYKPHVTRRVLDEKGAVIKETAPEGKRILAADTAATMKAMLHAVTEKGGTAEKLAIPGYPAGGKTGTAQKVDPLTRRYSTEKWASSFVGFAPLDDPRLVIFVMVDEPSGTHFGSAVAGPIWHEAMADALRYLNVPPSDLVAAAAAHDAEARQAARRGEVQHVAAAGEAERATDEEARAEGGYVAAEAEGDGAGDLATREVPDFRGLSIGEALEASRRYQVPLELHGTGLAVSQEPRPGTAPAGVRCRVIFAPPG